MDWKGYLPLLEKFVIENKRVIKKDLFQFINSDLTYRNISYTKTFSLILLKEEDATTTFNIGYPFPMLSKETKKYEFLIRKGISLKFFLRGEPIRTKQRLNLFSDLSNQNIIKLIKIGSLKEFRNLTKKICKCYNSFDYYDPYFFVGDSFIGTYLIYNFEDTFKIKLDKIYSNSYKHLKFAFDSNDFNANKINSKKGLCIIGDYIDFHWDKTTSLVKKLLKKDKLLILLGRNIIIEDREDIINVYHLDMEDHLLKNQNIEDYMDSLLKPYLIPKKFPQKINNISNLNIFINPFGSEKIKILPKNFIIFFIKSLLNIFPEAKFILSKGLNSIDYHKKYINEIKVKIKKERLNSKIILKSYSSLSEIAKDIKRNNISIGLTTDTSISHLFNFMGIINLSFFNSARWDKYSIQSLSSDSPLGFCRYSSTEIPIIFRQKNCDKIINNTIKIIKLIKDKNIGRLDKKLEKQIKELKQTKDLNKINNTIEKTYINELNNKRLSWLNNLFNPISILKYIELNEDSKYLFYSAWKLNILNKISMIK